MIVLPDGGNPRTATTPGASFDATMRRLSMSRWHTKSTPLLRMTRSRSAIDDCGAAAVNASADYLVTHNLRDFATAGGFAVQVVTPGQFLKLLDGGAP